MKPVKIEKQSVAWFKLAEFVSRGEKERALSLYRLLTHSLNNDAFVKKLEADILAFFEDSQALSEYVSAAHMYNANGHTFEAFAVYEHLLTLEDGRPEYYEQSILLATELGLVHKVTQLQEKLCLLWLKKGKVAKALTQFKACENNLDDGQKIDVYKAIITAALTHKYAQQKTITDYLEKALDGLMRFGSDQELKTFLADLKALNTVWHKDATTYLSAATKA